MNDYSIIETRPINGIILLGMFVLLICAAGAVGVYYTKSHLLEVELVNERQNLAKMTDRANYLEGKAEVLQNNYVDLILTGYVRVGPGDMRDLVQQAQDLREAAGKPYPTHLEGIGGGEEIPVVQPKKSKRKGKRSRKSTRKASRRQ